MSSRSSASNVQRLKPFDRVPPQALEAEQAVLGSMMIERQAIDRATEILRPEDFYRDAHRVIYEAIIGLAERHVDVDMLSLTEELRRLEIEENVGGAPYLLQLTHAVPSAANIVHYANIVEEKAILRRLLDASNQIQALVHSEYDDISEIVEKSERAVIGSTQDSQGGAGLLRGEMPADQLPESRPVQELWFAVYPAKAHLLIGETGAGKSSLLYNFAIHASRNEPLWRVHFGLSRPLRVLYIDPENAGNYRDADKDGGLCRRKLDRILNRDAGETCPPNLVFHDGEGMNLSLPGHQKRLERRIKRGVAGQPFDIVIIDPLLPMFGLESEDSNAEMGRVSDTVRLLSRRTGAGVLVAHHTGKSSLIRGVLSGRGGSALPGGMDVVLTWRARGPEEDEVDEDYTGETRERSDICRLRIEKDRPAQFGKDVSLYLRMAGRDRFERVGFQEWKQAANIEKPSSKAEEARRKVLVILDDGAWHDRQEIVEILRTEGIGRNAVDTSLDSLQRDHTIRCHAGARNRQSFCSDPNAQFPSFPVSLFPDANSGGKQADPTPDSPIPPSSPYSPPNVANGHAPTVDPGDPLAGWDPPAPEQPMEQGSI